MSKILTAFLAALALITFSQVGLANVSVPNTPYYSSAQAPVKALTNANTNTKAAYPLTIIPVTNATPGWIFISIPGTTYYKGISPNQTEYIQNDAYIEYNNLNLAFKDMYGYDRVFFAGIVRNHQHIIATIRGGQYVVDFIN